MTITELVRSMPKSERVGAACFALLFPLAFWAGWAMFPA